MAEYKFKIGQLVDFKPGKLGVVNVAKLARLLPADEPIPANDNDLIERAVACSLALAG